ncbi:hypothetical protein PG984_008506 [Apiospora sp. TS-2023a]
MIQRPFLAVINFVTKGEPVPSFIMQIADRADNEKQSTEPPQAGQRRQAQNPPESGWVTPDSAPSQATMAGMAITAAVLCVSHHRAQELDSYYTTCLFVLLKLTSLFWAFFTLDMHGGLQTRYEPPFKGQECPLAAVLAVCASVIYRHGEIGLAFFTYQAEMWFWAGYWFEWWTGIIAALSYLFGCTTRKERPFVLEDKSVGGWSLCVARFLVRIGDML